MAQQPIPTPQLPADDVKPDEADVQAIIDFSREFMAARESHIGNASSILERAFKSNENAASFYEKVILFDSATIALSLSFLGYMTSHQASHIPRVAFLWLVCPAWGLLLSSIYCCSMRVTAFHNTNTALLQQFSGLSSNFYHQHFGILFNRISTRIKSGVRGQNQSLDLKQMFSQFAALMMKQADEENAGVANMVNEVVQVERKATPFALIGTLTPIVAVILLCI